MNTPGLDLIVMNKIGEQREATKQRALDHQMARKAARSARNSEFVAAIASTLGKLGLSVRAQLPGTAQRPFETPA